MKAFFFIISLFLPTVTFAQNHNISTTDSSQPVTVEQLIVKLERAVGYYETANAHFEKGIEEQKSNPTMKNMYCMAYRASSPKTLAKLRALSADIKIKSNQMSDSQLIRYTKLENTLATSSPDLPLCAGT